MKKLTAMLAILLALVLTLSCALAEDSTTYSLSLLDPILYQDGETVFDLTGLNVDLVASVTDGAAQALSLELYAGDNYDYITSLQVQLAEEGVVLYLDGMSQSYCLSYDQLAEMTGDETSAQVIKMIAPMVKGMTLRSAIDQSTVLLQQATEGMNLDMFRWLPVMGKADEIVLDDEGKCVLPIHVELEEGSQALAGFRQNIEQSVANSEVNMNVEAFSADGEMTVYSGENGYERYTIDLSGEIKIEDDTDTEDAVDSENEVKTEAADVTAPEEYIYPYTLTVDVTDDDMSGEFAVTQEDGTTFKMVLSKDEEIEDPNVYEAYCLDVMEDDGYYGYFAFQRSDDEGDWFTITAVAYGAAEDGSEDGVASISFVTDFNDDVDYSWGITVSSFTGNYEDTDDLMTVYFTYQGLDDASSDGTPYRAGYVELGMENTETTVDFSTNLVEMRTDGDSEEWVIPYADSVNISEMDESDMTSAQMGLVGVIGEVVATLQEQFPIFEEIFADMGMSL